MNFNLISPTGNGNDYTINFRDPITIPRNAKISTNWVELKRNADIVLEQDGKIDIVSTKCLPTHIPGTPATENSIGLSITVIKGVYELSDFQQKLEDDIQTAISADSRLAGRYRPATAENNNQGFGSDVLDINGVLGITLEPTTYENSISLDATNSHDEAQLTSGGEVVEYTTANNSGTFDNYALFEDKIDFYRAKCDKDPFEQDGFVQFKSINNIHDQTGKLFFGLYGKEYANGIGGAPPTRTHGNSPPLLSSTVPKAFIGVVLGSQNDHFEIYIAQNSTGETLDTWTDQNQEISSMALLQRIPVVQKFNPAQPYEVLFGLSISNDTDSPSIRYQIANYQNGEYDLIYDSEPVRRNIPFKFLKGDSTTYDNATALNSQIPFVMMMSVTNADEGFEEVAFTKFQPLGVAPSNTEPMTIMRDYQITVSDNLIDALGMKGSGIYPNLFPNGCQDNANPIDLKLDINWRSKNYSIFINLPTNNYKNIADKKDGGFKKSILANIPVPFTSGFFETQGGTDNGQVVSTYIPYNPIVSFLNNNEIQTNNLSIKIVDMLDEKPATEVIRSIVNFTIEEN